MDRQEMLADDMEPRRRQQVMNIRHTARDRIFDRDHGERSRAFLNRREGILEGRAGQGLHLGEGLIAGDLRVGTGLALEGNQLFHRKNAFTQSR